MYVRLRLSDGLFTPFFSSSPRLVPELFFFFRSDLLPDHCLAVRRHPALPLFFRAPNTVAPSQMFTTVFFTPILFSTPRPPAPPSVDGFRSVDLPFYCPFLGNFPSGNPSRPQPGALRIPPRTYFFPDNQQFPRFRRWDFFPAW